MSLLFLRNHLFMKKYLFNDKNTVAMLLIFQLLNYDFLIWLIAYYFYNPLINNGRLLIIVEYSERKRTRTFSPRINRFGLIIILWISLIPHDKLFKVPKENMGKLLHINIGPLIFKGSSTAMGKGSGLLISSNLVLTSAHNICNHSSKQKYYDFKFYPGH